MKYHVVKTCLAVGSRIDVPEITRAKKYLASKYGSKYDFAPHITFLLIPYREESFKKVVNNFESFFSGMKPFTVKLDRLLLTPRRRFFSIEIDAEHVKPIHEGLFKIALKYRDNEISFVLHTDAPKQTEMAELWRKSYKL